MIRKLPPVTYKKDKQNPDNLIVFSFGVILPSSVSLIAEAILSITGTDTEFPICLYSSPMEFSSLNWEELSNPGKIEIGTTEIKLDKLLVEEAVNVSKDFQNKL